MNNINDSKIIEDSQLLSLKEIMKRAIQLDHVVISNERLKSLRVIEEKYRLEKEMKL